METEGHDERASLHDEVEPGACVLFLAPSLHTGTEDGCLDLLSLDAPAEQNVLWVTYTRSPDDCVQDWMAHADAEPGNVQFVNVGETTRSASARTGDGASSAVSWQAVETLANPGDLTGLGIKLSEVLKQWEDNDNRTVACFDSLTALLQYADLQRAFRFLHVVTGRVKTAEGVGHYHLDPEAHDRQTLATLKGLFDAVVEVDEDESVSVQQ